MTREADYPIDFVMIWVDGNDPEWQKQKNQYAAMNGKESDARPQRYRDWNNLKYWFRSVERFTPWVNRIFFVTCGHLPDWLNTEAPKLKIIKHSDYMPAEYLPTFSSHPIELNLHRIDELSERFVYFNDDTFICRALQKDYFFKNGKPVLVPRMHDLCTSDRSGLMMHIYVNNMLLINRHFRMKEVLRKNKKAWFSPANGLRTIAENAFFSNHTQFPGFFNEHMPVPIMKGTMQKVWEVEQNQLDKTSRDRFRDMTDVNQYIFRFWQLTTGEFEAKSPKMFGKCYQISHDNQTLCSAIETQKYPMICIQDYDEIQDEAEIERAIAEINTAFEHILPEKSSFEK